MQNNDFDWYEDTIDAEVGEFSPRIKKKSIFESIFDVIKKISNYTALISLGLFIIRYLLNYTSMSIKGVSLNIILVSLTVFFGSFSIVVSIVRIVVNVLKQITSTFVKRHIENMNRPIALTIWFLINLYFLQYIKDDIPSFYKYARRVILSGVVTSALFTAAAFTMENFYIYFLQKSLYAKINQVDIREKILHAMKNYRYEIFEVSSSESYTKGCLDLICGGYYGDSTSDNGSHIDLHHRSIETTEIGDLFLQKPEIYNLFDAKTLARDVFLKASSDGNRLTFEDFSSIFPNKQVSLQAFSFFDTSNDKEISKKDFRDTIISFFAERMNLERNIEIAEKFVEIVGDVLYSAIFGFLILAYLVIFGIQLKDLLAFALSSALVLHFLISGMATDLYFNVVFVLSHPFDVGDDVIIDGVDLKVYEIGLSNTSFLGSNGGKIKYLNSSLWKKNLINMTRAPEKKMVFQFTLDPYISADVYQKLCNKISKFLALHHFDFHGKFSLEATSENFTAIDKLNCRLVLLCRSYKTRAKKFYLRIEFTKFLNEAFDELGIKHLS